MTSQMSYYSKENEDLSKLYQTKTIDDITVNQFKTFDKDYALKSNKHETREIGQPGHIEEVNFVYDRSTFTSVIKYIDVRVVLF